ncbi:hypothetical protein [Methylobacterium nodulans]|uniref:Uncharacterized protein n=1 Tax=Methylobacterium nodulans (strain LMG 21967 / CNCM I-2342 / ORS 2060) TaxID=460265 RepID=B8IC81_METNO|nr:hypothetical protein [Methylobacterium nodulans]ACL55469.1 hypothetical protein Mnod_0427 [Methylobacterium nodulans ORS 2060]
MRSAAPEYGEFDAKKVFLDTRVKPSPGLIRGRVDIDPRMVGAGVTCKF